MNDNKNVTKKKRKRLKVGYILAVLAILIVAVLGIKMILPSNSSKYGDRLDGIKEVKFGKTEKNKIIDKIKENEKVTDAKIAVEGKIINVIFNITKETNPDEAKTIANDSLGEVSDDVKGFYDIQFMVTKKDEEGTKKTVTKDDGTTEEVTVTVFPIMGYKNSKSQGIVW